MILLRMTGGLGNQLFQYAFGKSLATRFKTKLALDLSWYTNADRTFELDKFNVNYDLKITNRHTARLIRLLPWRKINEQTDPSSYSNWSLADGYWESYKHFNDIVDTLRKEFTLKSPSPRFQEIVKTLDENTVSVHVRRGDYLIPHGKYLNTPEYYSKALALLLEKTKLANPRIIVFSDDKEFCRKEMSTLAGHATEIFDDPAIRDYEEFVLMSAFAYNVISNSTFSWWAAYLNKNPQTITVAPRNWFTDQTKNKAYTEAMLLPEWIIAD
jgi:hypothetical protein